MIRFLRPKLCQLIGLLTICVFFAGEALSQIVVTSALDQVAVNAMTSANTAANTVTLRSAIQYANLHSGTTITFSSSLNGVPITLTRAGDDNNALNGDLDILVAVTITGNGPTNTIIQGGTSLASSVDKIFSINPLFTNAFATSISGLTIRYGKNPSGYNANGFGGGLDWEGSGNGTLTINNCVITDNSTTDGDGGGITITNSNPGTGKVTITNTRIANNIPGRSNTSNSSFGGGIFVGTKTTFSMTSCTITGNSVVGGIGQGAGLFAYGPDGDAGSSTLTNCVISNNTAPSDGGGIYSTAPLQITSCVVSGNQSGRYGGGMWVNLSNATANVTKSTFISNTATSAGGAVYQSTQTTANGNGLTMSYCRIAGNTAGSFSGVAVTNGTATLTNNWWGCNQGPSNAACNQAGVVSGNTGSINFTPWIVLTLAPLSTTLCSNTSTTLTANVLKNSAGTDVGLPNLTAFIGVPISFSNAAPAGSTLTSVQTTIQANGTATAQFNAGPTGGNGGASVTLDNATLNSAITVVATPTASISYTGTPYCRTGTASVTLTGTGAYTGGMYSSTAGLSLNGSSGAINLAASTAGTYSVTYVTPVGSCASTRATTSVVIKPTPTFSSVTINPATIYQGQPTSVTTTVSGLLPNASHTLTYTLDGNSQTPVTASSDGSGKITNPFGELGNVAPGLHTIIISSITVNACTTTLTTSNSATITKIVPPDLRPIIYVSPSIQYGNSTFTVVVDAVELNSVPTSSTVTVYVTKQSQVSLTLPGSATSVGGKTVQNNVWSMNAVSSPTYYVLTTNAIINAGDKLSFGLEGSLVPSGSAGIFSISTILIGGSGGEVKTDNNTDSDKVEYFLQ